MLKTMEKGSLAHDQTTKRDIHLRLRTVSGHLVGVEKMIEDDAYCIDTLKQIAAIQSSLSKVALSLSESHMLHCVREAVEHGQGEAKINELMETMKYLKHF